MTDEEKIIATQTIGNWVVELAIQLDELVVRARNDKLNFLHEEYFMFKGDAISAFGMAVTLLRTTVEG